MAELRLIGPFSIAVAGFELPVTSRKNRALLAVLALSPGRKATREKLCGLLWGDRSEEQARASLRQSLASLKRELGEAEELVMFKHDDMLALKIDTLSVDALELHASRFHENSRNFGVPPAFAPAIFWRTHRFARPGLMTGYRPSGGNWQSFQFRFSNGLSPPMLVLEP